MRGRGVKGRLGKGGEGRGIWRRGRIRWGRGKQQDGLIISVSVSADGVRTPLPRVDITIDCCFQTYNGQHINVSNSWVVRDLRLALYD